MLTEKDRTYSAKQKNFLWEQLSSSCLCGDWSRLQFFSILCGDPPWVPASLTCDPWVPASSIFDNPCMLWSVSLVCSDPCGLTFSLFSSSSFNPVLRRDSERQLSWARVDGPPRLRLTSFLSGTSNKVPPFAFPWNCCEKSGKFHFPLLVHSLIGNILSTRRRWLLFIVIENTKLDETVRLRGEQNE